ncbi:UDP-glucose 4-epimerase GalE [Aerococcus christensenii]|uniref:UDP-glucose 4-epimerase n=1 Tax=Aerococcus christensenii TaxID=87541 RepID=A0A133Y4Z9_9LACT|nr:UDP-glucose 4-epimerase GalE [Aerococcus christensenii]KXB38291.1 UDP-glucose 4-epimerase [Aerococcus christensenii]MDK8234389.1 UDP-glucose 4-epimerase GalE [Aerococcus christensenii]PKY90944.1 UDP-glucose 4-epimerase GalE [Aerococcus christensenii]
MSILVTGGAGYIGSHTTVELIQAGYDVVIVDDLSNSKATVIDRIEKITGTRPRFYQVNILDEEKLDHIFQTETIEAIIHYAAFKAVGESVQKPIKYYSNNLGGLLSILKAMNKHKVQRIVYSSSATVYGTENPSPLSEKMPTGQVTNPYGYTKLMGERILKDTSKAHPNWSITILRYFNPIGAHESGLIGEDPQGIPNNLMPYITQVAIGKLEKLHIFGNDYDTPDGTGVRDYLHVVDLAKGHVAAIRYAEEHEGLETINLGTGQGYSVLDLVQTFEKVNHLSLPYVIDPRRPGDVASCYADPSYAKELLGWQTEKTLDDMCRDSWHWQESSPHGYDE